MKITVNLNDNNEIYAINGFSEFNIENSHEVEIETLELIHFGISQVINGVFVENKERYEAQQEMFKIKQWLNLNDYIK